MPTTTWSFVSGYEGWTFFDDSANASSYVPTHNDCPTCSISRAHSPLSEAIAYSAVVQSLPSVCFIGVNESPKNLNAAIQNGDTIEVDLSATSDALSVGIKIIATYTDATSEDTGAAFLGWTVASTITLTMTQNKTLDYITIIFARCTSGTATGSTPSFNMEEVRLITATPLVPTPGLLRTPSSVIEDAGDSAVGGAGGGAGNIASISADGLNIYIASFDNLGRPILIKISSTLTANGTIVFEPGSGERIGCACARFNADHVWVAGLFDSTNTIEKSEDDGASFTVKDPGTFGAIRTIAIGPDNDDRIMVFDGDNGDLIQSTDGGATWTTVNAAVSPLVNDIARFSQDADEIVLGNQGDATDSINYSPNTGVNLEDYQTGVYPNEDATKVIVNP